MISHKDLACQKACLRFGITMLEEGSKLGQARMLHDLKYGQGGAEFFGALQQLLISGGETIEEHRLLVAQEAQWEADGKDTGASRRSAREVAAKAAEMADALVLDTPTLVLRFLQLMCEGHFENFQDFLRDQKGGPPGVTTVNVLLETVKLSEYINDKIPDYIESGEESVFALLVQAFEFLAEAMQGPCTGNQACLLESDLPSMMRSLFGHLSYPTSILANATGDERLYQLTDETVGDTVTSVIFEDGEMLAIVGADDKEEVCCDLPMKTCF